MAYDIPGFARSYDAAGDLSASHFKFVKLSGGAPAAVTAVGDAAVGVLQNKPSYAGAPCTVLVDGVTKVLSAAAIAAGSPVYLAADGRVTSAQDGTALNKVVGIAEIACDAADELISVLLKPLGAL